MNIFAYMLMFFSFSMAIKYIVAETPEEVVSMINYNEQTISAIFFNGKVNLDSNTMIWHFLGKIGRHIKDICDHSEPNINEKRLMQFSSRIRNMTEMLKHSVSAYERLVGDSRFVTDLVLTADKLEDLMLELLTEPSRPIEKLFLTECQKADIPSVLVDMKARLTNDFKNPLLESFKSNPQKKADIYHHGKGTIYGLLYRLTFIQSFCTGLRSGNEKVMDKSNKETNDVLVDIQVAVIELKYKVNKP